MSFSKLSALAGVAALASKALAHGTVTGIVADGVYYEGYHANFQYMTPVPVVVGWSTPQDLSNGFISPDAYATSDIICHLGATNAGASATVAAGGTVELQWSVWPSSHHGPVIDYLANCNGDCTSVDKTALEFFKIDGVGLIDDTTIPGTWATDELIANNNSWTVTVPSDIAPGNYVLRHEIIALHSAGESDGAQNYPQCFNLEVTGSGTATPTGTKGEALYTETEAGIIVNIYATLSSYVVPGPTLYSGAVSISQTMPASATAFSTGIAGAASGAASAVTTAASSAAVTSAASSSAAVMASSTAAGIATSAVPSSSSVSAAAVVSSIPTGAPYSNGTVAISSKKSKSACKAKTSSVLVSSAVNVAAAATSIASVSEYTTASAALQTTSADSVTIATTAPTSSEAAAGTETSKPSETSSPAKPTGSTSSTTAPSGTTLGDLLSWLSSFYTKHSGSSYDNTTAVSRRHARDLAARAMEKFDEKDVQATGTAHHHNHHHHHHHPTGTASLPRGTGFFEVDNKAFGTGFPGFGGPQPTGAFGHAHPTGSGHVGGGHAKPTGKPFF